MYLHVGNDVSVRTAEIIGIFDFDYCSVDKRTRQFLNMAQRNREIVDVSQELPKSFVVTSETQGKRVYITNVSPATLYKRTDVSLVEEDEEK